MKWLDSPAARSTLLALALMLCAGVKVASATADTYQYDVLGRLTKVTYASGASITYTYDDNGNLLSMVSASASTAVQPPHPIFEFRLEQNVPEPASREARIRFALPQRGRVSLRVFDLEGRVVATLADGVLDAGEHDARFDAARRRVGVYFYRLSAAGRTLSRKMVVLK